MKKRKRLIKWQRIKEVDSRAVGEKSPYWDWVHSHGFNGEDYTELPIANPDVLAGHEDLDADHTYMIISRLHELLSDRERQITDLLSEGKSEREIVEIIQIPRQNLQTYKQRIRKKLDKVVWQMRDNRP